jgi:hypothetical protein
MKWLTTLFYMEPSLHIHTSPPLDLFRDRSTQPMPHNFKTHFQPSCTESQPQSACSVCLKNRGRLSLLNISSLKAQD